MTDRFSALDVLSTGAFPGLPPAPLSRRPAGRRFSLRALLHKMYRSRPAALPRMTLNSDLH